eukprot:TRINITY_DN1925_c0_g1_i7.p1 TRINITY_DN1925_c0_g1~~TRINITY_DN1925_c0_g1_i7.p1  ORF type:complete len:120 (-),score=1.01 TRINITY_DN1925_c0_g1_i7:1240-1599(-)
MMPTPFFSEVAIEVSSSATCTPRDCAVLLLLLATWRIAVLLATWRIATECGSFSVPVRTPVIHMPSPLLPHLPPKPPTFPNPRPSLLPPFTPPLPSFPPTPLPSLNLFSPNNRNSLLRI